MFWKGVLLFAVAGAAEKLDSIQQDQLTGKGIFDFFKSPVNDMDRALVAIRQNKIFSCIGYRVNKKFVTTTTGCKSVYPKLNPKVSVTFGLLPGLLLASRITVDAKNSINPKDCGELVFVELKDNGKLGNAETVKLYEKEIAENEVIPCTGIMWEDRDTDDGFLKGSLSASSKGNYLITNDESKNVVGPSRIIGSVLYVGNQLLGIGLSYNEGEACPYRFVSVQKFREGIKNVLNNK